MIPSSTGCEQSTVNLSTFLLFTTFFALAIFGMVTTCVWKVPTRLKAWSHRGVACGAVSAGSRPSAYLDSSTGLL